VRGKSAYTLGIHADNSVDFAFVDGDHSYEGCLADLRALWSKMKRAGGGAGSGSGSSAYTSVILVHDCESLAKEAMGTLACVNTFAEEVAHPWHYVEKTGIARFYIL
jgi:hypothetical protein